VGGRGPNRKTKGNQGSTRTVQSARSPHIDDQPHRALAFIRTVSGPAFILGGAGLIPIFFWFGVSCVYVGFFCLMAEAIWEPRLLQSPCQFQVVALAAVWIGAAVFTIAFVGRAEPLNIDAVANLGNYPDGSSVDGISWKPGMSELRVLIANPTDEDFEGVDLHVKPDQWVREVVQVGKAPNLSITTDDPSFAIPHMRGPDGKDIAITHMGASYGFRIICDKLPRKSRIEILAATGVPAYPGIDGVRVRVADIPESGSDWPARRLNKTVMFAGTYHARFKEFRVSRFDTLR
jgi:hypothetical protein